MYIYSVEENDGTYSRFIKIDNLYKDRDIFTKLENIDTWYGGKSFGKRIKRQQRWYNVNGDTFCKFWKNSFKRWESNEYEKWLIDFQNEVEELVNTLPKLEPVRFNSVLINKYNNGSEFINAHKDDEMIFGNNPTIVSVSFGATRYFTIKRVHYDPECPKSTKLNKEEKHLNRTFELQSGDLLIMSGSSQKYFSHEIEKDNDCDNVRYNLTFRNVI